MFDRILIGTDLTSQSSGALQLALKMAAPGARILAVHVIDMPPVLARWENPKLGADVTKYRELLKRQIAEAELALREQLAAVAGSQRVEAAIRVGHPPTHLATAADQHRAEVILVGRGAGGRLGPVAEAVVRLSGRTVVVAPVPRSSRKQRQLPSSHRRRGRSVA